MGLIKEFKEFALRGNVIDLAVGVIIGAAFGKVVNSVVNDVMMPPIGKVLGGVNFNDLYIPLTLDPEQFKHMPSLADARKASMPLIAYGSFLTTLIEFTIVAFCVFMMVKAMNLATKGLQHEKPPEPTTKDCPLCCMTIPVKATRCGHCSADLK